MTHLRLRQPRHIRPTRGAYLRLLAWMAAVCMVVLVLLILGYMVWWWFVMGY